MTERFEKGIEGLYDEGVGGTEEMEVVWSPPIHTMSCGGDVRYRRCECEQGRVQNGDFTSSQHIC